MLCRLKKTDVINPSEFSDKIFIKNCMLTKQLAQYLIKILTSYIVNEKNRFLAVCVKYKATIVIVKEL
jgi:hypothetical protein